MTVTLSDARCIVDACEGVRDVHGRGYRWFSEVFEPAVRRLAGARALCDLELASFGYYLIGDVHDFNGAPKAAIRAYQASIHLDPSHAAAWREIGGRQAEMGQRCEAEVALRHAVALDAGDELAAEDLDLLLSTDSHPVYEDGDEVWASVEALAAGQFAVALDVVASLTTLRARLQRARICGARQDASAALAAWRDVERHASEPWRQVWDRTQSTSEAEWTLGDWFYVPRELWDSAEFWTIQSELRGRLHPGSGPPDLGDAPPTFDTTLRYHMARTSGDELGARRILREHPGWRPAR